MRQAPSEASEASAMRRITMTTGAPLDLDGELLTILEAVYREVTLKQEFQHTYEDVRREVSHIIDQMNEEERLHYFIESLSMNFVKYENDKLDLFIRKLTRKREK
jgi:hypothetical protein